MCWLTCSSLVPTYKKGRDHSEACEARKEKETNKQYGVPKEKKAKKRLKKDAKIFCCPLLESNQ